MHSGGCPKDGDDYKVSIVVIANPAFMDEAIFLKIASLLLRLAMMAKNRLIYVKINGNLND